MSNIELTTDNTKIGIKTISPEKVLQVFYNNAIPVGNGEYQFEKGDISLEEAKEIINHKWLMKIGVPLKKETEYMFYDYVKGRRIKVYINLDKKILDYGEFQNYYGIEHTNKVLRKLFE